MNVAAASRQRGLTLVELMISIVIGSLVVLAASALLLSSKAAYTTQVDATRLQDGGRYALEILGRTIRQTGYRNLERDAGVQQATPAVAGLDAMTLTRIGNGLADALPQAVNGSDVLALRAFGGAAPDGQADGAIVNCAGLAAPLADGANEARGWSIFYVARDAGGEAELRCKYHGKEDWTADAIARGVESFQVLYGLDRDADGLPEQFVSAATLERLDAALPIEGGGIAAQGIARNRQSHWNRIAAIRIGLLLRGSDARRGDAQPSRFDLFGQAYGDAHGATDIGARIDENALPPGTGAHLRKVFTQTIQLRNPPT